jgi:hypothetical protein
LISCAASTAAPNTARIQSPRASTITMNATHNNAAAMRIT